MNHSWLFLVTREITQAMGSGCKWKSISIYFWWGGSEGDWGPSNRHPNTFLQSDFPGFPDTPFPPVCLPPWDCLRRPVLIFHLALFNARVQTWSHTRSCFLFHLWAQRRICLALTVSHPHLVPAQRQAGWLVRIGPASFVHSVCSVLAILVAQGACMQHLHFWQKNQLLRQYCENQM